MNFKNIETPALLVEQSILDNNIQKKQRLADRNNIALRPHIKTHKSCYIARMQIDAGAKGIAVAKIGEAEVFADCGFDDIQIAYLIIGENKIARLYELSQRIKRLTCCVDSRTGAEQISEYFSQRNAEIEIFIKVDIGYHRTGVEKFSNILNLANHIEKMPGVKLAGLLTHAGMGYAANSLEDLMITGNQEGEIMAEHAMKLEKRGVRIKEISVGSTPTSSFVAQSRHITELRCGNYVFYDMIQVSIESCNIEDCALTCLATVISKPTKNRVVIDAGSKALNLDKGVDNSNSVIGYGHIIDKNATIERLSEEHGIIYHDGEDFSIGETIRIIPNHACVVMNLFDHFYLVDGENVLKKVNIDARGRSQ